MLDCKLRKNGECTCPHKCAKLIWYERGREDSMREAHEFMNKESYEQGKAAGKLETIKEVKRMYQSYPRAFFEDWLRG